MCGLYGILNTRPRPFDFTTFATLGINNDIRGGDSCGVFIDGQVDFGVDKEKLFVHYVQNSELVRNTAVAQIAMGHDRKASTGYAVNLANAQPCVIKDENENIVFCVTHNGTIYNVDKLAEKYIPNIDIKGMTDSQIMTLIFFHAGYDCLNEYNGTAAFIIADYRGDSPRVFLYKGASRENKWDAKDKIVDERPLYYVLDTEKEELVYSSIPNYFVSLRPNSTIYTMTPNMVWEFVGTGLTAYQAINREEQFQKKEIVVHTTTYSSPTYSTTTYQGGVKNGNVSVLNNCYEKYIVPDKETNRYLNKNIAMAGKSLVTRFGKIEYKKNDANHEVWFYNGVLLPSAEHYHFLIALREKLKLTVAQFYTDYENLIRFLSVDQVYKKGGLWVMATGINSYEAYTGEISYLGYAQRLGIVGGHYTRDITGTLTTDNDFNFVSDIDLTKLKEECESLIK